VAGILHSAPFTPRAGADSCLGGLRCPEGTEEQQVACAPGLTVPKWKMKELYEKVVLR